MGEAFITRRGGGGGYAFAQIVVDYPEGSTCTCSNGTKTLEAKDTSGRWIFRVPSVGTWTVTATDGTETKSVSVSITTKGQIEEVSLTFWDGSIYKEGDEYEDKTGGWTGRGDFKKLDTEMSVYFTSYNEAGGWTVNKVDLTGFSTLNIHVTNDRGGSAYGILGITDDAGYVSPVKQIALTKGDNALDISEYNTGSYHVLFGTGVGGYAVTDHIWLS